MRENGKRRVHKRIIILPSDRRGQPLQATDTTLAQTTAAIVQTQTDVRVDPERPSVTEVKQEATSVVQPTTKKVQQTTAATQATAQATTTQATQPSLATPLSFAQNRSTTPTSAPSATTEDGNNASSVSSLRTTFRSQEPSPTSTGPILDTSDVDSSANSSFDSLSVSQSSTLSSSASASESSGATLPDARASSNKHSGSIAGISAAVIIGLLLAAVGVFYWWKRRQKNRREFSFIDGPNDSFIGDDASEKSHENTGPSHDPSPSNQPGGAALQRSDSDRSFLAYPQPPLNRSHWNGTPAHHLQPGETPPPADYAARIQPGSNYDPRTSPAPDPLKTVVRGSKGFFESDSGSPAQGNLFPPVRDTAYGPELQRMVQDSSLGALTLSGVWSKPTQAVAPLSEHPKSGATLSFLSGWAEPSSEHLLPVLPPAAATPSLAYSNPHSDARMSNSSTAFSRHLADQAEYFKRGSMVSTALEREPEILASRASSTVSQVRIGERQFIPSLGAPPVPELPRLDQLGLKKKAAPVGILKKNPTPAAVMRESESQTVMRYISHYN